MSGAGEGRKQAAAFHAGPAAADPDPAARPRRIGAGRQAVTPPSTAMEAPVMYRPPSPARWATVEAMSAGCP